jgi:iron complex transport system substrate-binding protein
MIRIVLCFLSVVSLVVASNSQNFISPKPQADLPDMPIGVTDHRGQVIALEKPAKRIVCLFQGALDALYMLGAEASVVGIVHNIYTDPAFFEPFSKLDERIAKKQLAAPGNWETASNIESIIALQPDLVIISGGQRDVIKVLEGMGIAVYVISSATYKEIYKEIVDLGVLTGTKQRAEHLVDYSQKIFDRIKATTENITPKARVYYGWSGGRVLSTSGRNSMMNDCIELAGATNVCTTDIDQPNVNAETLLNWDPDLILLWNSSEDDIYDKKELSSLKAVRNRAVYKMEPTFFYNTHTLKILFAALALNEWAYGKSEDPHAIENAKHEIMTELYGAKAERLLK